MASAQERRRPSPAFPAKEPPGIRAWRACSVLDFSNSSSARTAHRTTAAAASGATPALCGPRTPPSMRRSPRGGAMPGQLGPCRSAP